MVRYSPMQGHLNCAVARHADTIAVFPYLSGTLTWVAGSMNDHCGPRVAVTCGCAAMAAGNLLYWLVAARLSPAPAMSVPALVVVGFVTQLGNGFIAAGIFTSLVRNFPHERGLAVGIGKSWIGLSSGILTQLYVGLAGIPDDHSPATLDFLLLMAAVCLLAGIGPARLIKLHDPPARPEPGLRLRFAMCYCVIITTAALITCAALLDDALTADGRCAFSIAIVATVFCPVFITCAWTSCPTVRCGATAGPATGTTMAASRPADSGSSYFALLVDEPRGNDLNEAANFDEDKTQVGTSLPELPMQQVLLTPEWWLLSLGATCLVGGGQMVNINSNQMCESLGYGRPVVVVRPCLCLVFTLPWWRQTVHFPSMPFHRLCGVRHRLCHDIVCYHCLRG